ncbi:MAG: phnA protein [Verrucomicrobiota bacterium]
MARGHAQHQARAAQLKSFGKDLARREKSKCELCELGGQTLEIVELPPVPRDPDFGRSLLLRRNCADAVPQEKQFRGGDHWRFLAQSVWSEVPAVQALALRFLRRQEDTQAWAREALETAFVDEEVERMAAEAG